MTREATSWAEAELERLDAAGLRRTLEPLASAQGAVVRLGQEELLNFSSNDYLGLARHPALARAANEAAQHLGFGTGASRLVVGDTTQHAQLEEAAGQLFDASALLFNSGYAANAGILSTLAGRDDAIFSDALNHASLIDGARLSRAKVELFPHRDVAALEKLLASSAARRKLVCTDAVFSMDGDLAPLADLADACERHAAALVVDEAHAFGVFGPKGRGLSDALGLASRVDVRMFTLGKAAGSFGAFAVGSEPIVEWLRQRARSFVFSTSLPPPVCAASGAGLQLLAGADGLRRHLWQLIEQLAAGLGALGIEAQARSPVFPIVLGSPARALEASQALRARGLLVKAIRPPTVPEGTSRLRVSLSAAHTKAHVDQLLEALETMESRDVRVA